MFCLHEVQKKCRKSLFKCADGRSPVLQCFLLSWLMELKGKRNRMEIVCMNFVLRSLMQCRLLVYQMMPALVQFLPKYVPQILQEPSSITACLCYIPHEQILLRRWSRLYPNPALRQMFPHLWGSNSLNVLLPAVSGRWGRGVYKWLIFDIMQCLSIRSDYWNLPYILPLQKIVYVCMCVYAPILPEQYLALPV